MTIRILEGDCRAELKLLPPRSVHMVVTSPPYFGLRDYGTGTWAGGDPACDHLGAPFRTKAKLNQNAGVPGQDVKNAAGRQPMGHTCSKCSATRTDHQIGLESTPQAFVAEMVLVFREVWRVLRDDGTLWLNLGDSYANDGKWGGSTGGKHADGLHGEPVGRGKRKTGLKPKDLIGIPWRVAFALQDDGWYLRQDDIWFKPNPMPESVDDRCTKAHEYIFMLSKSERYFFDAEAIAENRVGDEDAATFRGGAYVRNEDNAAGGGRTTRGNRRRGMTPRHSPYTSSCDQSGLDETGRGGRRNKRSVWTVASRPFSGEFCRACQTYFEGPRLEALRVERIPTGKGDETTRVRHCSCGRTDSWVAHFATFPPDLIKPCIQAGSSEKGACASCGAPWKRILEKVKRYASNAALAGATAADLNSSGKWRDGKGGANLKMGPVVDTVTTGWEPTCDCPTIEIVPCTVLDTFGGAGTTALVADRLGRDALLIELNPDYAEMSRQRVRGDSPLFSEVS